MWLSFFLKTVVCEKPVQPEGTARQIRGVLFSKTILEIVFLIAYHSYRF